MPKIEFQNTLEGKKLVEIIQSSAREAGFSFFDATPDIKRGDNIMHQIDLVKKMIDPKTFFEKIKYVFGRTDIVISFNIFELSTYTNALNYEILPNINPEKPDFLKKYPDIKLHLDEFSSYLKPRLNSS